MILTTPRFAEAVTLASAVVVQGLGVHQTCPPSPLMMTGPPVCASTSKAARIYGHRDLSHSVTWDGPLDCQGDYCVYSNRAVSKHPWAILCTTPEAAQALEGTFHIRLNERPPGASSISLFRIAWKGSGPDRRQEDSQRRTHHSRRCYPGAAYPRALTTWTGKAKKPVRHDSGEPTT